MTDYNPISLVGKRFLITGAASGLGKTTSILLSKLGAELILVDINNEGLDDTVASCNTKATKLILNLQNSEAIKSSVMDAASKSGKLNGLVHLAGRPYIAPLKSVNIKTANDVFTLNTFAAIELSKAFTNKAVCSGENDSIVFVSSIYGNVGSSANVIYSMSKSALHGVTKSLAIELATKKIRVNCVAPGFVKTNMLTGITDSFNDEYLTKVSALHPLGLGNPIDVANTIAFLLSDMSTWITGSVINVDGGYTAQ